MPAVDPRTINSPDTGLVGVMVLVDEVGQLIDEVLGVESDDAFPQEGGPDIWDDFYEDPLDAEIRRLLDEDDRV